MKKSKRKKQEQTKRRFEAIKDLMSTFAMATVAVVAAVTLIPSSPKAEIIRVASMSEEVAYNVMITDEENALDLSTLFIVLENQLEYYESPLILGENTGYFEGLTADTEYRISIYGSKGFGQERLDTTKITTKETVGATILSVTPLEDMHTSSYLIDVSVYDPEGLYDSITLFYGYENEPDTEPIYSSILITEERTELELTDIFTQEPVHIYIEGITSGESTLLDEVYVTPPYELYTSIYMNYISNNTISFDVYGDITNGPITYQINLYLHDLLVKTKTITLRDHTHGDSSIKIDDLIPNTTYYIECIAIYTNPNTLREERITILEEEHTTLHDYTYTYTVESFDTYYEVIIELHDPLDYFQYAYYVLQGMSNEEETYIMGDNVSFEGTTTDKFITLIIDKPDIEDYDIQIYMRNDTDFYIKDIIILDLTN